MNLLQNNNRFFATQQQIDNYKPKNLRNAIAYYYTFVNGMGTENQCFDYIEKHFPHLNVKTEGFNKNWQKAIDKL